MNFRSLPGFPKLFTDFADGVSSARSLFAHSCDLGAVAPLVPEVMRKAWPEPGVYEAIVSQARDRSPGPATLQNLQRLSNALAVVGTIRPAALGGPLAVLLQCLSVAKIAAELNGRGLAAVPVCWVAEYEPAPAAENGVPAFGCACKSRLLSPVWLLDADSRLHRFPPDGDKNPPGQPAPVLDRIRAILHGQYSAQVMRWLEDSAGTSSPSSAVCRLLSRVTEEWGIIFVDAADDRLKSTVDLVEAWLDRAGIARHMTERRAFLQDHGYAEREEDSRSKPEHRLLPLLQQRILPVAVHVADPDEYPSLAVLDSAFARAGLPAPVVWPRSSVTVVDARSRKLLQKFALTVTDLFAGSDRVHQRILDLRGRDAAAPRLQRLETETAGRLAQLASLAHSDAYLKAFIEESGDKIRYQLGKLRDRYSSALAVRVEAERRQIERVCNTLAPNGCLQEYTLGLLQFAARYSAAIAGILYRSVDVYKMEHQIISVD
jgi:hypothetical protein